MNKAQLAEKLYELHAKEGKDVSKKHAEDVVEFVFDCITNSLKNGEEVALSGFGTFLVKTRKARTARNPRTGEVVQVPSMNVPRFRPGKGLKEAVK